MGAADQRIFSSEESLKRINAAATEKGDSFTLKVFRRTSLASTLNVIAAFGDAKAIHFTSPELWITELAGGGKFNLLAYHNSDLTTPVGSYITFPVDAQEPRDVDGQAWKKPGWVGPLDLQFPKDAPPRPQQDMPMYGIHSPSPAGSGPGDSAARQAWPRPAGGGLHRMNYGDDESPFGAKARAIEEERRRLEQEKLEAERERHRLEARDAERRHEAELKALELRFETKFSKPTGPDPAQQLLTELLKQQAEDRRIMEQRRLDDAKAEREREERRERERKEDAERERAREERREREERERQDRLERERREDAKAERERFEKVLERLGSSQKDPLEMAKQLTELTKAKGNDADVAMKSLHNVLEMQGTVMGSAMDFVREVSQVNLGGGEPEPGWLKGLDRLVKGFGKMALAAPPQMPFQQGQRQPPAQQPQGQRQPSPQQQQQQAVQEAQGTIADQIAQGIRDYHDPEMVAKAIVYYYRDPSVQQLVLEAGGDFEAALLKKLGNWPNENASKNQPYLAALVRELQKQLVAVGHMEPDAPEGETVDGSATDADDEEGDEAPEEGDEPDDE